MPLNSQTFSIVFKLFNPFNVALTILIFVLDPNDLETISLTPANSNTARTAPPAMIPVPRDAGFRTTRVAPLIPIVSCGIVLSSTIGTLIKFLLALFKALLTASGTSALCRPSAPHRCVRIPENDGSR